MEKKRKFISTYEFLGRAAGSELGTEVHKMAKYLGEEIAYKQVETPYYTGSIAYYPTHFLNYIFTLPRVYTILTENQKQTWEKNQLKRELTN